MSLSDLLEERLAVGAFELDLAALEALEHVRPCRRRTARRRPCRRCLRCSSGRAPPARRDMFCAMPPSDCGPCFLAAVHERRPVVEALVVAVGAGQLPVEIDGAAGILAAGRLRIGRDDAVGDRLDGAAFIAVEKVPGPGLTRRGRIAGVGLPGQRALQDGGAGRRPPGRRGRCLPANRVGVEALENRKKRVPPSRSQRLSFCNVPRARLRQM